MWSLAAFVQGLVAGVVTVVALAIRAASEGRPGVSFADLWTAVVVGIAVGAVSVGSTKLLGWRMRRSLGPASASGSWVTTGSVSDRPLERTEPGRGNRFDKFTDGARRVLTLAQDEAVRLNHNYLGTEHLLLGLVRETDGTAARVLDNLGVEAAKVRTSVDFIIGRGETPVSGEVGLTPRAKRVIELTIAEARELGPSASGGHDIGTEHLLLGLLREGEGIGAGVLNSLGVDYARTRAEVLRVTASGDDPG
jgi:Clp amino terminal domain, pathogenicity island component